MYDQMKRLTQARKSDAERIGSISVAAERGMLRRLDWAFQAICRRCKVAENPGYPRVRQLARLRYRERVRNRNTCHRDTTRVFRSHGLIATQSWGLLRNQLRYKAEWSGREFVEVEPKYISQDCHRFGARIRPRRSERYARSSCRLRMDRDENGALNILRAGVVDLGAETCADRPSVAPILYASSNVYKTPILLSCPRSMPPAMTDFQHSPFRPACSHGMAGY